MKILKQTLDKSHGRGKSKGGLLWSLRHEWAATGACAWGQKCEKVIKTLVNLLELSALNDFQSERRFRFENTGVVSIEGRDGLAKDSPG